MRTFNFITFLLLLISVLLLSKFLRGNISHALRIIDQWLDISTTIDCLRLHRVNTK